MKPISVDASKKTGGLIEQDVSVKLVQIRSGGVFGVRETPVNVGGNFQEVQIQFRRREFIRNAARPLIREQLIQGYSNGSLIELEAFARRGRQHRHSKVDVIKHPHIRVHVRR